MKVYMVFASSTPGDPYYPRKLFYTREAAEQWRKENKQYNSYHIEEWDVEEMGWGIH